MQGPPQPEPDDIPRLHIPRAPIDILRDDEVPLMEPPSSEGPAMNAGRGLPTVETIVTCFDAEPELETSPAPAREELSAPPEPAAEAVVEDTSDRSEPQDSAVPSQDLFAALAEQRPIDSAGQPTLDTVIVDESLRSSPDAPAPTPGTEPPNDSAGTVRKETFHTDIGDDEEVIDLGELDTSPGGDARETAAPRAETGTTSSDGPPSPGPEVGSDRDSSTAPVQSDPLFALLAAQVPGTSAPEQSPINAGPDSKAEAVAAPSAPPSAAMPEGAAEDRLMAMLQEDPAAEIPPAPARQSGEMNTPVAEVPEEPVKSGPGASPRLEPSAAPALEKLILPFASWAQGPPVPVNQGIDAFFLECLQFPYRQGGAFILGASAVLWLGALAILKMHVGLLMLLDCPLVLALSLGACVLAAGIGSYGNRSSLPAIQSVLSPQRKTLWILLKRYLFHALVMGLIAAAALEWAPGFCLFPILMLPLGAPLLVAFPDQKMVLDPRQHARLILRAPGPMLTAVSFHLLAAIFLPAVVGYLLKGLLDGLGMGVPLSNFSRGIILAYSLALAGPITVFMNAAAGFGAGLKFSQHRKALEAGLSTSSSEVNLVMGMAVAAILLSLIL